MSKYPTADTSNDPYPRKYYRGYYLIRDPQDWSRKGKIVPIRRMPGYMTSEDPAEEEYRIRRHRPASKQKYMFHPFISQLYFPPKKGVRIRWGIFE